MPLERRDKMWYILTVDYSLHSKKNQSATMTPSDVDESDEHTRVKEGR